MGTLACAPTILPWLGPFLEAEFYKDCEFHSSKQGYMYCMDCMGNPICHSCSHIMHEGHYVLQVRKASENVGILVDDIKGLLDSSEIHRYKINHDYILFLRSRQKRKTLNLSKDMRCQTCQWKLKEAAKFCSIDCKLKWEGFGSMLPNPTISGFLCEEAKQPKSKPAPLRFVMKSISFRNRHRKGIPRRAPMF